MLFSANQARTFDRTDRWMMAGSAVCLTAMLSLTYFVSESIHAEKATYSSSPAVLLNTQLNEISSQPTPEPIGRAPVSID